MQGTLSTRKSWFAQINWVNVKKSEAVVRRCSVKKAFLKISQNSQQNILLKRDSGAGVFL